MAKSTSKVKTTAASGVIEEAITVASAGPREIKPPSHDLAMDRVSDAVNPRTAMMSSGIVIGKEHRDERLNAVVLSDASERARFITAPASEVSISAIRHNGVRYRPPHGADKMQLTLPKDKGSSFLPTTSPSPVVTGLETRYIGAALSAAGGAILPLIKSIAKK
jgi:hypothetical protein